MGLPCSAEIRLHVRHEQVSAIFTVSAGERRIIGVVASHADPLFLCGVDSIDHRIDLTAASWRQWCSQVNWTGAGREQIVRSALTLKTLVMANTGARLQEQPGHLTFIGAASALRRADPSFG